MSAPKLDGARLKARYTEKGFTQVSLGEAIGTRQSHISAWVRGVKGIEYENLQRLADVLDTTVDYLTGRVSHPGREGGGDPEVDIDAYLESQGIPDSLDLGSGVTMDVYDAIAALRELHDRAKARAKHIGNLLKQFEEEVLADLEEEPLVDPGLRAEIAIEERPRSYSWSQIFKDWHTDEEVETAKKKWRETAEPLVVKRLVLEKIDD